MGDLVGWVLRLVAEMEGSGRYHIVWIDVIGADDTIVTGARLALSQSSELITRGCLCAQRFGELRLGTVTGGVGWCWVALGGVGWKWVGVGGHGYGRFGWCWVVLGGHGWCWVGMGMGEVLGGHEEGGCLADCEWIPPGSAAETA